MKRLTISLLLILTLASSAAAQQVLRQFTWQGTDPATRHAIPLDQHLPGKPAQVPILQEITVEGRPDAPTLREILTIDAPNITADNYAVKGSLRYTNVAARNGQKAHLEMWSYFPDGSFYFSRTLADSGPTQALEGSSDWREFLLPFYNKPNGPRPTRLIINIILPGPGTVAIRTADLIQFATTPPPPDLAGNSAEVTRYMISMTVLPLVMLLFAITFFLAYSGRARKFVYTLWTIYLLVSLLSFALGILSLFPSIFPYFPPGLFLTSGPVGIAASTLSFYALRRFYARADLRKITALDTTP